MGNNTVINAIIEDRKQTKKHLKEAIVWLTLSSFVFIVGLLYHKSTEHGTGLPKDVMADLIIVHKSARLMSLYHNGQLLKSYHIALGGAPIGRKEREGDKKTPEGYYTIDFHKADSGFHKALHISYPSASDTVNARRLGVSPGGDIMIHGIRNGLGWIGNFHRSYDWTSGCVAVTNWEIDEIWSAVPDGTPIEIDP